MSLTARHGVQALGIGFVLAAAVHYRASFITFAVLLALYLGIRARMPGGSAVAWMVPVGMATAFGDPAPAVAAAVGAAIVLAGQRSSHWSLIPHRIDVVAALASVVLAHATNHDPQLVHLAGMGGAAGALAALAMTFEDEDRPGVRRTMPVVEAVGAGVAAALAGGLYASAGPLLLPMMVAVLAIVATPVLARSLVDDAEAAATSSLLRALEIKDGNSRGHSERVAQYVAIIGEEMGLSGLRLRNLIRAGLLHDIGKVAAPRGLLRRRDRLSPAEHRLIQRHAAAAGDFLAGVGFLAPVLPHVLEHHGRVDGAGYGARTGTVSLEARILAVADAFDAMTTHRPYRRALSSSFARIELIGCAGSQFDVDVVAATIRVLAHGRIQVASCGVDSEVVARLAALGLDEVPEVVRARG